MTKRNIVLSISTALLLTSNSLMAKETKKLDDLVVTAQKSEENVQKVPMSLSVLDEYSIADNSIKNTTDIAAYIPNLTTMNAGSRDYFTRIAIRGISNTGIGDPAVALYIDDISYADLYAFHSPLFDIERIEVLKGPQGTLYGKNTEAGVINIITKRPTNTLESQVTLEAGTHKNKKISGYINAPLIKDKLFVKLAGVKSTRDGYIDNQTLGNTVGEEDTTSFRAGLLYKANDNLELNLILGMTKLDDEGGFPMAPMDKEDYKTRTGLTNLGDFESAFSYNGKSSSKTNTALAKINYTKDKYNFVSITGYRDMDNEGTLDGDFTPMKGAIGFNEREAESINQEFRLSATENDNFKWIVGAYFNHEDINHSTGYMYDEVYAGYYSLPLYAKDEMKADLGSKDFAIFGQNTYRFMDNKLGVTTGLRYEKTQRTMDNRTHTFNGASTADIITGKKKTFSKVLPKLTVDYLLTEDSMLYSTVSKGYKAGGFSYAVDDKDLVEFSPEDSTAFEVGYKSNFPEIGLMFNIAAFHTKVEDYQDRVQLSPTRIIQANATEVNINGVELESSYIINDEFILNGNFGITSAKYGDYLDPTTNENYKDNHVSLVPSHDFNLALSYRNSIGIFAKVEAQNTGSKYFDRSNTKKLKSFTIFNAKLGYEQDKWDIYFDIKNITNKEYFLDGFNDRTAGYMGTVGNPRTFNVTFNYRF